MKITWKANRWRKPSIYRGFNAQGLFVAFVELQDNGTWGCGIMRSGGLDPVYSVNARWMTAQHAMQHMDKAVECVP